MQPKREYYITKYYTTEYTKIYGNIFNNNENYASHSYGEFRYRTVIDFINGSPTKINNILDVGSGRGTVIKLIQKTFDDLDIHSCDLVNFHNIENIPFFTIDLSNKNTFVYNTVYDVISCLDVMEHLDKSFVEDVILYFSKISKNTILTVANHSDAINGVELHTIQEDSSYWTPTIKKYFTIKQIEPRYIVYGDKPRLYIYWCESKITDDGQR